jgi:3-oxoadipate enol-lactonase
VFEGAAGDDHDGLARTGAKRPRKVLRVGVDQRGAIAVDLGGVNEEARHGSTHGATPVPRYGAVMAVERLTATTHDGVDLAVFVAGEGAPLLLIPGLGARSSVFVPLAPDLSRHHRVITFDPRGLGESGSGGDITMANMALDAVAVLDAAGVETAAVFGASMGGLIAQHLVVNHPERVARLMLAATAPGGVHGKPANPADRAALLGKGTRTPEDAYRLACTVLYSPQFQRTHAEFIEEQIRERAHTPVRPRVFSEQLLAMAQPDNSFERLASVTTPTLILHGTDDVVTPYENARILARQIPGVALRPFDGCGHLFFHERPVETARVITEFARGD